jgi:hypothetical protein
MAHIIKFSDSEELTLPHQVQSQEEWDTLWPKLKATGLKWGDGDELDSFFSECHEFPEYINIQSEGVLVIEDDYEPELTILEKAEVLVKNKEFIYDHGTYTAEELCSNYYEDDIDNYYEEYFG